MISQTDEMVYRLNNLNTEYKKLNDQMNTGQKIQKGSEDTMVFSRIINTDTRILTSNGLKRQMELAQVQTNVSDKTMSEIKKTLEYIKAELLKAHTATTSIEGRKTIAKSLEGARENLFSLGNTTIEDQSVFAGSDPSFRPFVKDEKTGEITYRGNDEVRKVAVDEKQYSDYTINGYDSLYFTNSSAYKGEDFTVSEKDMVFDQDGGMWQIIDDPEINNTGENPKLRKLDHDKEVILGEDGLSVKAIEGTDPQKYTVTAPDVDGTRFKAKTSVFEFLDETIKTLNGVDQKGNAITDKEGFEKLGTALEQIDKAYESINIGHSKLGTKSKSLNDFKDAMNTRVIQLSKLELDVGGVNLEEVAMRRKEMELTFNALFSTIKKTDELSLVNFLK